MAIALAAVSIVPSVQGDWLQEGYDAAKTGMSADPGPGALDAAFQFRIPATNRFPDPYPDIVIMGQDVFVLTSKSGPTAWAVTRLNVTTGTISVVLHGNDTRRIAMASDGQALFLLGSGTLYAYRIGVGGVEESWQARVAANPAPGPAPGQDLSPSSAVCAPPVVTEDRIYVACLEFVGYSNFKGILAIHAVAKAEGRLLWTYTRATSPEQDPMTFVNSTLADPTEPHAPPFGEAHATVFETGLLAVGGLSVIGDLVMLSSTEAGDAGTATQLAEIRAIHRDGKTAAWTEIESRYLPADPLSESVPQPPAVTGDGRRLFLEMTDLRIRNSTDDAKVAQYRGFRGDQQLDGDKASGMAFDGSNLYVTSQDALYKLDSGLNTVWSLRLPDGESWAPGTPILAGNRLYIQSTAAGLGGTLHVVDAGTGADLKRIGFGVPAAIALSGTFLVAATASGELQVIGQVPGSLRPRAAIHSRYPAPGALARADLSATEPGALGAATQYAADWGDGAPTAWQASAILEHRYAVPIDATAMFFVRNDANQTASMPFIFHVGSTPPGQTFLERSFDSEHQNTTFFILGLAATALFGLFGFLRLGRKRRRLEHELRAVEALHIEKQADPVALEHALQERRRSGRELYLRRRLDEGQYSILERRIDELAGATRLSSLEEGFDFLPIGIAKTLEGMLRDGRISRWERRHFLAALDGDKVLTPEQRRKVRVLIDGWFARDARGASPRTS